mgnify:CR=1 FL=1
MRKRGRCRAIRAGTVRAHFGILSTEMGNSVDIRGLSALIADRLRLVAVELVPLDVECAWPVYRATAIGREPMLVKVTERAAAERTLEFLLATEGCPFLPRPVLADAPAFGCEFTVQFAIDMPLPNTVNMVPLRTSDDFSCAFVWANGRTASWKTDPYAGGGAADRPDLYDWDGRYWSGALDATSCCATFGTSFLKANGAAVKTRQGVKDLPSIEWTFGGRASAGWNMQGRYFALRAYSRKLTDAELLQNRKADEARFYNRLYVTNVVVAADSRGLKGAEPPEAYEIEGSWTFTAAPQQLVVDGETVTYTPSGYVLETLENGVWSHPERFGGASCTLSGDNAVRRLTWRWRSDRGTMIILR